MQKKKKSAIQEVSAWFYKIYYIKNQIDALSKIKGIPLLSISVFLLKVQYVEFQLKQLITSLDLHLFSSNTSKVIKPQTRTPRDLESAETKMIGQIIKELHRYKGNLLSKLISDLGNLNKERIKFNHKLFDPEKDITSLHREAEKGIILCDNVMLEIENIKRILRENDPLDSGTKVNLLKRSESLEKPVDLE